MGKCKIDCKGGRVREEFREASDINQIVRKYKRYGLMPRADSPARGGMYGDFSIFKGFSESMEMVTRAKERFDMLPVELRKKLNYDPANFIAYVQDPKNEAELIELGLKLKPTKPVDNNKDDDNKAGDKNV